MKERNKSTKVIGILLIICILMIAICAVIIYRTKNSSNVPEVKIGNSGKIDDWEFENQDIVEESSLNSKGSLFDSSIQSFSAAESASDATMGFSTGGAKDVENFRENIEEGYFPIATDITYNGIFYDYAFDTGKKTESEDLFSPSYSTAVSKDPISEENEYYMTVGLNSNIKESDFSRKKLNLVVVLDISGSMSSPLDSYYYDSNFKLKYDKDASKSKMQLASESVNILIDQLKDDDRFGMVLFDNQSYIGKPVSLVGETDIDAIKNHILEIEANGGTNFEAGYQSATELLKEYTDVNTDEYENRIIVITDAMPNTGTTSDEGLLSYVNKNSKNGTYTTFIGVGVDFNTELIEAITDVKGANYYSVHSAADFKERMGEQFEYMVTPLVFDLKLNLESEDYEIAAVYGSDTVNKENGDIMEVNTLFPSKTTSTGEVKGGVVLLKLNQKADNDSGDLKLDVSYTDRNGEEHSNSQTVEFKEKEEYYENAGIRKAILLTRYVNVLKNWILYERSEDSRYIIVPTCCDLTTDEIYMILGENERTSVELTVSQEYKEIFENFKQYMKSEKDEISDDTLNQEIELLDKLISE